MGRRISYRDVLRHRANGRSIREIAAACSCSSSAVQDILARAEESGVGWDDVAPLTDGEARRLVRGNPGKGDAAFAAIDFERIDAEMARDRTMTLSILWEEYYASAVSRNERPYLYSRFCELYAMHKEGAGIKGRKNHVPGDLGEFDYAGKTMSVIDELTGEEIAAYLFVACLPFSQKTYVRADPSMDIDHWVEQSMLAFEFFGGVPRILTTDNLKVGITKHANDEIVVNRTFREFAEHYNIAVIPHAIGRPTGKGSVESSVDKIANRIRNMLRNRTFFSFDELNAAIAELLAELNARPFQKREGSRESVFAEKEAPFLQELPRERYDIAHWGPKVKVPSDYHLQCVEDHVYYSVPWRFAGAEAEMRTTMRAVEIFVDGARVASHVRDRSLPRGWRVTDPAHRHPDHDAWVSHDSEWFRLKAKGVGPACLQVVNGFLGAGVAEEQGWGWCEKLLRKLDRIPAQAIESACETALTANAAPSYKTVNTIIRNRAEAREAQRPAGGNPWALRRFK